MEKVFSFKATKAISYTFSKYCRTLLTGIINAHLHLAQYYQGCVPVVHLDVTQKISQGEFFHSTESVPELSDQKPYFVMLLNWSHLSETKIIKFKNMMCKKPDVKF